MSSNPTVQTELDTCKLNNEESSLIEAIKKDIVLLRQDIKALDFIIEDAKQDNNENYQNLSTKIEEKKNDKNLQQIEQNIGYIKNDVNELIEEVSKIKSTIVRWIIGIILFQTIIMAGIIFGQLKFFIGG